MTEERDSMTDIRYDWIPVEAEQGVPFVWGGKVSAYMKSNYSNPGVYRWSIWKGKQLGAVYIGESEYVARRIGQYLSPGSRDSTNRRLHDSLEKQFQKGLKVQLEILHIEPTLLNSIRIANENLSDTFLRRLIENLIISDTDTTQCALMNCILNPIERRIHKAKKMNQFDEVLRKAGFIVDHDEGYGL
jgi:hypothetical protein